MLYDASITREIASTLKEHYGATLPPLVVDPVCVSTSGHTLLQPEAVATMISELLPLAALITPNISEAELLLTHCGSPSKLESTKDMLFAAKQLLSTGCKAVLVKGGHLTATMDEVEKISAAYPDVKVVREGLLGENMEILQISEGNASPKELVVDVLQETNATSLFVRPRIESTSTHGTGCTLSSALACALARGKSCQWFVSLDDVVLTRGAVAEATRTATAYVHLGIETAEPIGHGHGPLNHLHPIITRSVPQYVPVVVCSERRILISYLDPRRAFPTHLLAR